MEAPGQRYDTESRVCVSVMCVCVGRGEGGRYTLRGDMLVWPSLCVPYTRSRTLGVEHEESQIDPRQNRRRFLDCVDRHLARDVEQRPWGSIKSRYGRRNAEINHLLGLCKGSGGGGGRRRAELGEEGIENAAVLGEEGARCMEEGKGEEEEEEEEERGECAWRVH